MTSWNINGDSGGAGTVTDGQTVTITGGNGISTVSTPGTRTISIGNTGVLQVNSFGGNITLNGNADSTVGSKAVLTANITVAGTGYVANTYYPTTKATSVIGTATGVVVRVTSVNGTGGITGIQVYGGGKDWTVGDTLTVDFGTSSATLAVASVGATGTVTTTTWRGLSGTDVTSFGGLCNIRNLGRFEDELTMYPSTIFEVVSNGASSSFTSSFLQLGAGNPITPIDGISFLDNRIGDLGLISRVGSGNIKIGAYGNGWDYSDALCLHNIGIGQDTNRALTTGNHNTAIGDLALYSGTTTTNNIAIGQNALYTLASTGGSNIAIGGLAGRDALPNGDTMIGANAARYLGNSGNPAFSENRIAIGNAAMIGTATNKHENNKRDVVIGDRAKQFKSSSSANDGDGVYIGSLAGSGYDNFRSSGNSRSHVCIGAYAMSAGGASAREGQVAIGAYSSYGDLNVETETYNTSTYGIAIGYQAEGTGANYKDITRSGIGNIAIGYQSAGTNGSVIQGGTIAIGTSAIAQGENSIAIGKNSDASSGAGVDNAIAIGFGAQATFANSVAIGTSAATTSANTIAFGSNTQNLGVVASSVATASTHKWPVRINGVDYNILLVT